MIELDPSQFAPEVKSLLIARGQDDPPLQWNARPNRIAANTLDDMQNSKLLGSKVFADEAQVASVRALLYLWNGWPREARGEAKNAPELERILIDAIVERQAGNTEPAKTALRKVGVHPIFKVLAFQAMQGITGNNPSLIRLRQTVQQYQLWEPFLFVDVFQQALAGKFNEDEAKTIRSLQLAEFTLLFRYCYEQATGETVGHNAKAASHAQKIDTQRTRELAKKHRDAKRKSTPSSPSPEQAAKTPEQPSPTPAPDPGVITVTCPKCKKPAPLPVAARGQGHQCGGCGAKFLVPQAQPNSAPPAKGTAPVNGSAPAKGSAPTMPGSAPAAPSANAGMIGMRCPKCQHAQPVPEANRGQAHRCIACGAAFTIPQKKSPVPTA